MNKGVDAVAAAPGGTNLSISTMSAPGGCDTSAARSLCGRWPNHQAHKETGAWTDMLSRCIFTARTPV